MKNKRLLIILIVLFLLTGIIVLCSTVFTFQTIDVVWVSTTKNLQNLSNDEIVKTSKVKLKSSVFLFNKSKCLNNIEKNIPYIKVENVEIKFPNKLEIKVSEREELYALKVQNADNTSSSYVSLDYDFKVLKMDSNEIIANEFNPIVLNFTNQSFLEEEFNCGEFVDTTINSVFKNISKTLINTDYNITKIKAMIKSFDIEKSTKLNIKLNTSKGVNIEIRNASVNTELKMLKIISVYSENNAINAGEYRIDNDLIIREIKNN